MNLKRFCLNCVCVDSICVDFDFFLHRIFFPECLTSFFEYWLSDFNLCVMICDSQNQNRDSGHVGEADNASKYHWRMLLANIIGVYCQHAFLARVLLVTVEHMLCFCLMFWFDFL